MWLELVLLLVAYVLWKLFFPRERHAPVPSPTRRFSEVGVTQDVYDYVVVGTGPAACALVHRLVTAKPEARVVMLEAGGDLREHPDLTTLDLWGRTLLGSGRFFAHPADWAFDTFMKAHKRWEVSTRGKTLGGTAAINAQMWVVGDPRDWDAVGDEEWSWAKVRPLFDWLNATFKPRNVSTNNKTLQMVMAVLKGFTIVPDHQEKVLESNPQEAIISTTKQCNAPGKRLNPFDVLIEPLLADKSKHVRVVDHATVERVVLNAKNEAVGVVFSVPGRGAYYLPTEREVILCAGTFNSAQLLLLSGIGPRDDLVRLGIQCHVDLPVGRNLMDHTAFATVGFLKQTADKYDGSMTDAVGFYKSNWSREHESQRGRDMQMVLYCHANPAFFIPQAAKALISKIIPFAPRTSWAGRVHTFFGNLLGAALRHSHVLDRQLSRAVAMGGVLNHPRSRGSVRLSSADPHAAPVIDLGMLDDRLADMPRLVDCVKRQLAAWKTEPLASNVASFDPGTQALFGASDAAIEDFIERTGTHCYHPVGTASIGRVCDFDLMVKNTRGLRVADCSVLPDAPSGNTMVPALLVGCNCARLICEIN
jgi:choline dehydrogenase